MAYGSVGAAFTNSYNDYLAQQEDRQRQQANDARLAAHQANEDALAKEALNEKRIMNQSALDEKEKKNIQGQVAAMQPGDIPPSELVAGAKRHGIPLKLQAPEMAPPPVPAGLAAEGETNTEPTSLTPQMTPDEVAAAQPANPPAAIAAPEKGGGLGPGTYAGSPGYLEAQRTRAAMMEQAAQTDDPQEAKGLRFMASTITPENPKGTPPPAGLFKIAAAEKQNVPVMTREQALKAGSIPPGTKVIEPIDTSARDSAAADRRDRLASTVYNQGVGDMKSVRTLGESRQATLDALATHLEMKDPTADAVVVPELLKSLVSGAGSGFRMTTYEINKIENARSIWETMKAKLQKFAGDPEKARLITDSQREQMTKLLTEARKSTQTRLDQANAIERKMDKAYAEGDINSLHSLRSEFHERMAAPNDVEKSLPGGGGRKTPEQLLKEVDDEMAAAAGKK